MSRVQTARSPTPFGSSVVLIIKSHLGRVDLKVYRTYAVPVTLGCVVAECQAQAQAQTVVELQSWLDKSGTATTAEVKLPRSTPELGE